MTRIIYLFSENGFTGLGFPSSMNGPKITVTGGLEDDQDGDGESEYFGFLGLNNPNDQTSNGLVLALTGTFTDTATNEEGHQFSWEIRENTVIGVDYDVQLSTDLDGFVTGIPGTDFTIEASDSLGNGLDRINIRVLTDAERQFLRLISP